MFEHKYTQEEVEALWREYDASKTYGACPRCGASTSGGWEVYESGVADWEVQCFECRTAGSKMFPPVVRDHHQSRRD